MRADRVMCTSAGPASGQVLKGGPPSISPPGWDEHGELPWPPACEGSWDTGPDRTGSLSFTALWFLTIHLCVTMWCRSVSSFWWWAPGEQRLFISSPHRLSGSWTMLGMWKVISNYLLPECYNSISLLFSLRLIRSFWICKVPSVLTECYQTRGRVGNHLLLKAQEWVLSNSSFCNTCGIK